MYAPIRFTRFANSLKDINEYLSRPMTRSMTGRVNNHVQKDKVSSLRPVTRSMTRQTNTHTQNGEASSPRTITQSMTGQTQNTKTTLHRPVTRSMTMK